MYKNKKNENGQIIVLLAISLVVIMMVAALAVDGGMIYSERRFAQNAADSASLAGGSVILYSEINDNENFVCPEKSTYDVNTGKFTSILQNRTLIDNAVLKAQNVAYINNVNELPYLGYRTIDKDGTTIIESYNEGLDSNHGIIIECDTTEPQNKINVVVRITSQISTAFAHLFYSGGLVTTNEAITVTEPGGNIGFGEAIISLSKSCNNSSDGGMWISGSPILTITGGGTHSNSCVNLRGVGNEFEINLDENKFINYLSELKIAGNATFPVKDVDEEFIISYPNPEPVCGEDEPEYIKVTKSSDKYYDGDTTPIQTINEKKNISGIDIQNGNVHFSPGLYCVTGDITITGGFVTGEGVTFFLKQGTKKNGDPIDTTTKITANSTVLLAAPYDVENDLFGTLFLMDDDNYGEIHLVGNNASYFSGLIYAHNGTINIGGTSTQSTLPDGEELKEEFCSLLPDSVTDCEGASFATQIIGDIIILSGSGEIDIFYNEHFTTKNPNSMYLSK